ncbi:MAG: hypothetical protein V7638_4234 [Acidobacteriota bacterium]|jgi:hypothetical protein
MDEPTTKWKLIKVTYSAQFDRVVRVPVALTPAPELLGKYLDVDGNFVLSADVIKPETLTILAAEEVQPPPDAAGFIQADGHGHRTRFAESQSYNQICVLCGANDGFGILTTLKARCPNAIGDEDYRTAKKDKWGSPLN